MTLDISTETSARQPARADAPLSLEASCAWRAEALAKCPQRLREAVSPACRQLLCVAAVLGPRLDPVLIAEMIGQHTAALLPVWEEALGSGILVAHGGELAFTDESSRRAVLESMPAAIRRALTPRHHRSPSLADAGAPLVADNSIASIWSVEEPASARSAGSGASAGSAQASGTRGTPAAADQQQPDHQLTDQRLPNRLTAREEAVLSLLAQGRSNQQIARAVGISSHAVKRHVSNLMMKFGCTNRTEVALLTVARHQHQELPAS